MMSVEKGVLSMKYCIYSNNFFKADEMNIEHIIPKSLGGSDQFTILVNKDKNSKLGSTVDGKFANDFLIKMKQIHLDYRGHSKKTPYLKIKNSKIKNSPVNVTFSKDNLEIYDPINKKILKDGNKIQISTRIDLDIRFKFLCKVALSTGYFLYGDNFVKYADHKSLRKAIFSNSLKDEKLDLRFYDNLHPVKSKDQQDINMMKFLFKYINSSCVIVSYSPKSIIVHVAIGGDFIGMVNFKADIKYFPNDNSFRLGKVLTCRDGKLIQKSFWKTIYDLNKDLNLVDIDDSQLDW